MVDSLFIYLLLLFDEFFMVFLVLIVLPVWRICLALSDINGGFAFLISL